MARRYVKDIELRQLRYFVMVAGQLNFHRAAMMLGIAQPPLTQQIQKLERMLGTRVFLRRGHKTTLTEAGKALLEEAEKLLRGVDEALERTRRVARGETGQLTVGVPPSVMLTRLPEVIRMYRQRYPEVEFTLREMATSAIQDALLREDIDVGFLRVAFTARIEFEFREGLVAVLPAAHRLAKQTGLDLSHMSHEPFVFFPRRLGEEFYDQLSGYCVAAGFTPRVVQEATQWQSVVTFVEAGMGVSIAPKSVEKFRSAEVAYRPLNGLTTTVTVCSAETRRSAAAEVFLKMVRAALP